MKPCGTYKKPLSDANTSEGMTVLSVVPTISVHVFKGVVFPLAPGDI